MEKLDELRLDKYKNVKAEQMDSKYQAYSGFYGIASGTVFMGFFLGIAFLAMMASALCLKFFLVHQKILRVIKCFVKSVCAVSY